MISDMEQPVSMLKMMPVLSRKSKTEVYGRVEGIVKELEPKKSFYEELEDWLVKKNFKNKDGQADPASFYHYAQIPKTTWNRLQDWSTDCKKTRPSKETMLKIVIGLELTIEEAEALMKNASHSFESGDLRDRVIMACLHERICAPDDVYEILKYFSQKGNGKKRFRNIYCEWEKGE